MHLAHSQWPDEVKARIVSDSMRPGATVNKLVGRYVLKANHLASRRTQERQGKLVLPEPKYPTDFAEMVIATPWPDQPPVRLLRAPRLSSPSSLSAWRTVRQCPGSRPSPVRWQGDMSEPCRDHAGDQTRGFP